MARCEGFKRTEYEGALTRARVACDIVSDCAEYQCTYAFSLYRFKRFRDAQEAFRLARSLHRDLGLGDHPNVLVGLAMTSYHLGQPKEATSHLERAAAIVRSTRRGLMPKEWYGDSDAPTLLAEAQALICGSGSAAAAAQGEAVDPVAGHLSAGD